MSLLVYVYSGWKRRRVIEKEPPSEISLHAVNANKKATNPLSLLVWDMCNWAINNCGRGHLQPFTGLMMCVQFRMSTLMVLIIEALNPVASKLSENETCHL